ncbi:hypothetical protein [Parabacteroides sp. PF5-6]|uniref:hypothetical protein n=1 Tax=Parabacteroides sp. PF5-6 TaxID=1742403 RepID=UPI0024049468|nr:hypothetical protein [Parabacteroides sp. PF5-6]MDF9829331.1 hypothetical protein [Parabacteroides sp. PF5-6]
MLPIFANNLLKSEEVECKLELYFEQEKISIYSIRNEGEEKLELEKFLEKFPSNSEYKRDIDIILAAIKKIIRNGALERYFKPEGSYGDGVGAIPIEGNRLRLYCIRISDSIIVFGNGDVKRVKKWQECPVLSQYVEQLKKLQIKINKSINSGKTAIDDNEKLTGVLKFKI